jgi:AmmeMemoRadiSam system protein B
VCIHIIKSGMGNAAEGVAKAAAPVGTRTASHADDQWYYSDEDALTECIQGLLNRARLDAAGGQASVQRNAFFPDMKPYDETDEERYQRKLRALVVPHGPIKSNASSTAAAAYQYCNPMTLAETRSILVLYPSHDMATQYACKGRCAVTGADFLDSPAARLRVDAQLRSQLVSIAPDKIEILPKDLDEAEHAAEVQLPWIAHVLRTANLLDDVMVTTVMVGSMSTAEEIALAVKLRPILQRKDILTIVTTNLCYWNMAVGYQPVDPRQSVPNFLATQDRGLVSMIERKDVAGLAAFWLQTDYTTCGRSALALWLRCNSNNSNIQIELCKYAQSTSSVESVEDSCVTYASLVASEP